MLQFAHIQQLQLLRSTASRRCSYCFSHWPPRIHTTTTMSQTERIKEAGLSEKGDFQPEEGQHVSWKWGGGFADGHVAEVSDDKMVKETKPGVEVTRNGEPDNPAVYIERDGNNVVKKKSELYQVLDE